MPPGSLVRLAYYPFLPEVRNAVRDAGADLDAVLVSPSYEAARRRAVERIEGALADGFKPAAVTDERGALHELLSVPIARMLCVALAEKVLVARYAAAEARRVAGVLTGDSDPDALDRCAQALAIPLLPVEGGWRLHVSEYLRAAPLSDPQWKLILRQLDRGSVVVDRTDAVRLVEEALKRRIVEELDAERTKPLPEPVKQALAPLLARLAPRLEEARESWTTGDFGPVQPGLFPPCIKELFEMMRRGENVPHHGRFAFATFLNTIGWNSEQIMDYMSTLPNFDREKSRYQIEHVTGQRGVDKYTPPGCGTMQTNGVCPLDKRDGLCFKIKHPLSYYRAKLRFAANDAAKTAPPAPAVTGAGTPAVNP
ncbi:MAG: DNA primase large subunit PriL [Candidatus Thermoplasmatota archaeon]